MIKRFIISITGGDKFVTSVFTLLSGATFALVISYLAQPVLTRLFDPAAFGLFDAFLALVTILIPFASLRYEDAVMIPEKDEEALHIIGLSSLLIIATTVIITLLLVLNGPYLLTLVGSQEIVPWMYWIPPVLICMRFTKLGELWLSRKKQYPSISTGQVAQASIITGGRIGLNKLGSLTSALGLIAGFLAGQCIAMLYYGFTICRQEKDKLLNAVNLNGIQTALKRYRRFPIYSMPSTLLSALITKLPFLLILFFFDETSLGYFGRASGLFAIPLSLIGNAISQVFFVEGMTAHREGKLHTLLRKTLSQLILVGLFPSIAMMIIGPDIFGFLLGQQWYEAGQYLQFLAPWLLLASIASPLTRTFDILEYQRLDLFTSLGMFVIQTIALVVGGLTGNIWECLLYVTISGSIARFVQICIILKSGKLHFREAALEFGKYLLLAVLLAGLVILLDQTASPLIMFVGLTVLCLINLLIGFRLFKQNG